MINEKYDLPKPDLSTARRMLEVEFYVTFRSIFEYITKDNVRKGEELLRNFSEFFGVDQYVMINLYSELKRRRPHRYEIILMARWNGCSYREINKVFGYSHTTIKNDIKDYLNSSPRIEIIEASLPLSLFEELKKVVKVLHVGLIPIGQVALIFNNKPEQIKELQYDYDK